MLAALIVFESGGSGVTGRDATPSYMADCGWEERPTPS